MHTPDVYPTIGTRGSLDNSCIYTFHPRRRLDLQSLLALASTNTNTPPYILNNYYITNTHSDDSTTNSAFALYYQLPNARPQDILRLLMLHLTEMQSQGHTTDLSSFPNIATVHNRTGPPYHMELDDDPIRSNPFLIDPNIPYIHGIALPIHSLPTYGLTLLASRQVKGTVSTREDMLPPSIPEDTRKIFLLQVPTITRRVVNPPRPTRDPCTIYSPVLKGNIPTVTCSS